MFQPSSASSGSPTLPVSNQGTLMHRACAQSTVVLPIAPESKQCSFCGRTKKHQKARYCTEHEKVAARFNYESKKWNFDKVQKGKGQNGERYWLGQKGKDQKEAERLFKAYMLDWERPPR